MATTKRLSKQEYAKQKREEQKEMLEQAVRKLMTSEGWQEYLRTRAQFHQYSFSNVILINLQMPEATQVGGAKNIWYKKFNRMIKKGEKALRILAPQIIYLKDESGKIVEENGKKLIDRIWYRTVPVFDISQTEGDPVPEVPLEPITGDTHEEFLYRAEQFINGLGQQVDHGIEPLHYSEGIVHLNAAQPINAQVRELVLAACELAGNKQFAEAEESPRSDERQVIVDSAAYLVCRKINLDTEGMAAPEIAKASLKGTDPVKAMREFAGQVDQLADTVEEAISA